MGAADKSTGPQFNSAAAINAKLSEVRRKDPRYTLDAYRFVLFEAIEYTSARMLRLGETERRHLSGAELAEGMRRLALENFGFMAYDVWTSWGIKETRDLGEIVFNLVEADLLKTTPEDRIEDFDNVYDIRQGLRDSFRFEEVVSEQ